MSKIREPIFDENKGRGKIVCINIKDIMDDLMKAFPDEKIASFTSNARVTYQTWRRWYKSGRAEQKPVLKVLSIYRGILENKDVPLSKATPEQIYARCEQLGWDVVIRSGKLITPQEEEPEIQPN